MDIELQQEYTDEDIRWERNGVAKAVVMMTLLFGGVAFTIWLLLFMLFSLAETA